MTDVEVLMVAVEGLYLSCMSDTSGPLQFIRKMNGSGQSMLVKDIKERLWVLKPKCDVQGPNASGNEYLGSLLCQALSLPIPEFKLIHVDREFCNDPRVWLKKPSTTEKLLSGLHFVSRYLPDVTAHEVFEGAPPSIPFDRDSISAMLGMFVFDIWAMHADRRQTLFTLCQNSLRLFFFDNSHLFGGPQGLTTKPFVDGRILQKLGVEAYRQRSIYLTWVEHMENVLPSALDLALEMFPSEWLANGKNNMRSTLLRRLDHIHPLVELTVVAVEHRVEQMRVIDEYSASKGGLSFFACP